MLLLLKILIIVNLILLVIWVINSLLIFNWKAIHFYIFIFLMI